MKICVIKCVIRSKSISVKVCRRVNETKTKRKGSGRCVRGDCALPSLDGSSQ